MGAGNRKGGREAGADNVGGASGAVEAAGEPNGRSKGLGRGSRKVGQELAGTRRDGDMDMAGEGDKRHKKPAAKKRRKR